MYCCLECQVDFKQGLHILDPFDVPRVRAQIIVPQALRDRQELFAWHQATRLEALHPTVADQRLNVQVLFDKLRASTGSIGACCFRRSAIDVGRFGAGTTDVVELEEEMVPLR